jgi:hypothetical protein
VIYNGAWQTKVWAESLGKSFTPPGFCEPLFAVRAAIDAPTDYEASCEPKLILTVL